MAAALGAKDVFRLVRKGIDVRAVHAHVQKPFRFLLCGDPALIAEMRALLLSGHDDGTVPLDAAACLETILPTRLRRRATRATFERRSFSAGGAISTGRISPRLPRTTCRYSRLRSIRRRLRAARRRCRRKARSANTSYRR